MSIAGKIQLCYEERLILWSQYLPSFEQELLDLCERVLQLKSVSDSSAEIKQLVYTKDLPRACIGHQYLLSFAEEFFSPTTAQSFLIMGFRLRLWFLGMRFRLWFLGMGFRLRLWFLGMRFRLWFLGMGFRLWFLQFLGLSDLWFLCPGLKMWFTSLHTEL
eukprot:Em0011g234a